MQLNGLVTQFNARLKATPDRVFARTEQGEITFATLAAASDSLILDLEARGIRRGEHVAVMMHNSMLSLTLIYALLRGGYVWVPVNPALVGEGLAHALTLVEPAIVLCGAEFQQSIAKCGAAAREGVVPFHDTGLPGPAQKPWQGDAPQTDDLAAIMFTSGTTGPAKGVQVTHSMLETAARAVERVTEIEPEDILFMWEPFYHIGGAQVILLPIIADVTLSITDRFSASKFWAQVSASEATHIHHLGGILQLLLKQPPSALERAHKVRIAWGGGCNPAIWKTFEKRFGVRIIECYGMTESSSITTCNATGVVGEVGRPLPWFEVRVVDPEGHNLGAKEGRGEIVITSNVPGTLFPGYYRAPGATAQALRPDGFHTGDLGSWHEDGQLLFHGRMSDSIRCRGENVSAFEVEAIANRHPDIEESAMVGVATDIGELDIQLFVRLRSGAPTTEQDIATWLDDKLARFQRPRFISFIESFPKTPSQRIRKHLLPTAPLGRWDRLAPDTAL